MMFCGANTTDLADLLADAVAALFLDEEPAQSLGRDVGRDVGRIDALACLLDRVPIEIGGEDLQRKRLGLA